MGGIGGRRVFVGNDFVEVDVNVRDELVEMENSIEDGFVEERSFGCDIGTRAEKERGIA